METVKIREPRHLRVAGAPVTIWGAMTPDREEILTPEALEFLVELTRQFRPAIQAVRVARSLNAARRRTGTKLDFLPQTSAIREGEWRCAPLPADLMDRRVEITGPPDRKMVINALNSGARVFMADLEDSSSPTWANVIDGQVNLRDAVRRTISLQTPKKHYRLNEKTAVLFVRPRGYHLDEVNLEIDGGTVPGMLVDFGLYFFHNARELVSRGTAPYFYLPKMESHLEARIWNDIFVRAQSAVGLPIGTVKATCLIETLPAVFETEEILYELRDHSAGLNCGRWDYIFSYIKVHDHDPAFVLPDRGQVGMEQPFMQAYARHVIRSCHRRGVPAIGGMAAQIPIKNDPERNDKALQKVRGDKTREALDGHDGTWVAHPGLVGLAEEVFNMLMPNPNQIEANPQGSFQVSAADLLAVPKGTITMAGLEENVSVSIKYLGAWLGGSGCVPINNLMEDAATAEISRAQVWQWVRHGARLDDGTLITEELVRGVIDRELECILHGATDDGHRKLLEDAAVLFEKLVGEPTMTEFLTLPAYELMELAE